MSRWSSAFVSVAFAFGAAALLSKDSTQLARPSVVAYLGRISAESDPRYWQFKGAVSDLPDDLAMQIDLRFITALYADGSNRFEAAIDEALTHRPTVMVAPNAAAARAVRHRRLTIPVVFSSFMHPVRRGVISATLRRDEPFAGVWVADEMDPKRLELLHDAYPEVRTVAVLMDRDWGEDTEAESKLPQLGSRLGIEVTLLYAENLDEALPILTASRAKNFDAWLLPPTGLTNLYAAELLKILGAWGKPVMMGEASGVELGAPLALIVEESFRWSVMAELLARVLQGEPAGSIPTQRSVKTVLAVRPEGSGGFPAPSSQVIRRADVVFR